MKNNSFEIIFCISLVIILIEFFLLSNQVHISNQIRTLNNNTELLINRTDTILTILQD